MGINSPQRTFHVCATPHSSSTPRSNTFSKMTKYMVAVDGSEHSNKAYAIAAKLLTNKDEVIFVTVGQKGKGAAAQDLLETWTKKAEADGVRPYKTIILPCQLYVA